jgi:soluble lytic murein transglycosylase-like protein
MKEFKSSNLKIPFALGFLALLALPFLKIKAEARAQSPDEAYSKIIKEVAEKHGLEPDLIHSIIRAESNYDPQAVSSRGAMGLMQLMPETAKKYGVRNPFDPSDNIEGGVRYLKELALLYSKKTKLVLAAYNAGQEAIRKYGGIPPYPETISFIEKVKAKYPPADIRVRTKIYKFHNASGEVVLTNSSYIYSLNKEKSQEK